MGRRRISNASTMLFIVLAVILCSARLGQAESQLGCLEKSKGQVLNWAAAWTPERQDDGVEYEVVAVTTKNKMPDRSVVLDLKATGKAAASTRTVKADSEESARRICDRLHVKKVIRNPFAESDAQAQERDFIQYSSDGWVRGYQPANKRLADCPIGQMIFSCTEEDKQRYGSMLKPLEEQLRWLEE
jgi:hypothetical protein